MNGKVTKPKCQRNDEVKMPRMLLLLQRKIESMRSLIGFDLDFPEGTPFRL